MGLSSRVGTDWDFIKFIIFAALAIFFLYLTITSIQRLIKAGEEVEQAEKDYEQAKKESIQAEKEMDNIIKYGCANPTTIEGLVMCP